LLPLYLELRLQSIGFFAVAVVVADKFSADAEVLPLHVVGAPGVETDFGGVLHC